jgi:hypothetical protein
MPIEAGSLGRRPPTDFTHVERYPLTAAPTLLKPTPVVIGVNWYAAFDDPQQDSSGRYWIARGYRPGGSLGRIRGGHCVCLKPKGVNDSVRRQVFYDQGVQGSCVGFGISRMMTILNGGKLYLARWLWDKAKAQDEWAETNPGDDEGTSVRAGLDVLRTQGHVPWRDSYEAQGLQTDWRRRDQLAGSPGEGIAVNRWATSTQDALNALGYGAFDYVDVLNSWGRSWPLMVRMPATVLDRLRQEDGEIGIVTDR